MELKDIVAIAGQPGLHHIIGRNKAGLIVETIDAQKRRFPTNLNQRISVLEDIAMYTHGDEIKLRQVLINCYEWEAKGNTAPDAKASDADMKTFMQAVVPDYDEERVYISDIRKLARWFQILRGHVTPEDLQKEPEAETEGEETVAAKEKTTRKTGQPASVNQPKAQTKSAGKNKTSAPRKMGS